MVSYTLEGMVDRFPLASSLNIGCLDKAGASSENLKLGIFSIRPVNYIFFRQNFYRYCWEGINKEANLVKNNNFSNLKV